MKTNWKKSIVLTILLSLLLVPNAWAELANSPYEYLDCTILDGGTTVSVKLSSSIDKTTFKKDATLTIPSTVSIGTTEYTVTEIGTEGFRNMVMISIELPSTLTTIGYKAFAQCNKIRNNELHNGESEITIPESVTRIGCRAFYNTGVKHAVFKNPSPADIFNTPTSKDAENPSDLFYMNYSDFQIHIPAGSLEKYKNHPDWKDANNLYDPNDETVKPFIIDGLYYQLLDEDGGDVSVEVADIRTSTTNVTIPATVEYNSIVYKVTKIADAAFRNTSNGATVTKINFTTPSNIKCIGDNAFTHNNNLTGVFTIPASVDTIGFHAFFGCNNLTKIVFEGKAPILKKGSNQTIQKASETFTTASGTTIYDPIPCQFKCGNIEPGAWDIPILHDCPTPTISQNANGEMSVLPDKNQKYFGKITYKRVFTPGIWETLYLPFELEDMTVTVPGVNGGEPFSVNTPWQPGPGKGGFFHLAVRNGEYFDYVQNGDTLQGHTAYIIQFPSTDFNNVPVTFTSKSDYNKVSDFAQQGATIEHNMYGNTTLQKQTLTSPSYYLGTDNNFKYADTQTLNPFECYLTPIKETQSYVNPRMMSVRFRPQSDVTTDVPNINADQISWQRNGNTLIIEAKGQPVSIYNINGALIQSFTEGQEQIIMELTSGYYIINSAGTAQKIIF